MAINEAAPPACRRGYFIVNTDASEPEAGRMILTVFSEPCSTSMDALSMQSLFYSGMRTGLNRYTLQLNVL